MFLDEAEGTETPFPPHSFAYLLSTSRYLQMYRCHVPT